MSALSVLLTVENVAERLQVSRQQVYAIKPDIGYVCVGKAIRFRPEDVEAYIRTRLVRREDPQSPRPLLPPVKLRHVRV